MPRGDDSLERSFLGDAASRLSRLFSLGGPITPLFNRRREVDAVVLVGDGTLPGMADTRGLQFGGSINQAGGGAQNVLAGWRFGVECWVDSIRYRSNTAGTEASLRFAPPADAANVTLSALAQTALTQIDRGQQLTAAPVTSFGSNATAPPAGFILHRIIPVANVDVEYLPGAGVPLFVAAGSVLWFTHNLVAPTLTISIRGRTF